MHASGQMSACSSALSRHAARQCIFASCCSDHTSIKWCYGFTAHCTTSGAEQQQHQRCNCTRFVLHSITLLQSQQLGRGVDKRCWHLQDVSHTPALAGREPQAALPVQRRGQHVIGRQAILESQGLGRLRRQAVQQGARLAGGSEGRTNRSLAAPATLREQATPALVSGGASSNDRHNRCTVRGSPAAPVPPHAW